MTADEAPDCPKGAHLLTVWVEDSRVSGQLECVRADCEQWTVDGYGPEGVVYVEPRRCWVTTDAQEYIENDEGWGEYLENLGRIELGTIPVRVWNNGADDECYPVIDKWEADE